MMPYEALSAWLKEDPTWAACVFYRGEWKDLPENRDRRIVALVEEPGMIDVHQQMYHFRIPLVGPTDWQSRQAELQVLRAMMERLVRRLTDEEDFEACGVAQINVIGGIMGPGYTDTGRPWYGISLQLIV